MDTNFTDPLRVCQAEPPHYVTVRRDGHEYRLKWVASKGKYRLHLYDLPTLRGTYYGPDPTEAARQAVERLPGLLALAAPEDTNSIYIKPKDLLRTDEGIKYKLTLHKTGE